MVILITGASGGIGRFLATYYTKKGCKVYGTYYSNGITEQESGFRMDKVDVSNHAEVETWIESLALKGEKIVLLNTAGISYNTFGHKADIAKWKQVIDVNLVGSFNTCRYVLPIMREAGFGRIINFSSVVAQIGVPGTSAYATSKAALWGLSKALAVENAVKGITVNALTLGYFNIGMISTVPDEMKKEVTEKIPMRDFGNPDNIIHAIDFLINSEYTSGESLNINGALY